METVRGRQSAGHRLPNLIVGAGLGGAVLAWLSARAGEPTLVLSSDRPASQGTSLSPGFVRGFGPPGTTWRWTQLPPEDHARSAGFDRIGFDLLRTALLASGKTVWYHRCGFSLRPPSASDAPWLDQSLSLLEAAGWPVQLQESADGPILSRSHKNDAVLSPRRLVFELLRQAQGLGAVLQFRPPFEGLEVEPGGGGREARIGRETVRVGRVFWTEGPFRGAGVEPALRHRLVLRQILASGSLPLPGILQLGDGGLTFSPDPTDSSRTILTRWAEEAPAGGLAWPELPPEWAVYRGRAIRQQLAEAAEYPEEPVSRRSGDLFFLRGVSSWPIASVFGICHQVFSESRSLAH